MDGCPPGAFPNYSMAKAFTAVSMGMSSRMFRDKYTPPGAPAVQADKLGQMLGMIDITGGKLAPFPGGVLLMSAEDRTVVGSIGVSGAASDEDEYCAIMGARAAGVELITEPAEHSCATLLSSDAAGKYA